MTTRPIFAIACLLSLLASTAAGAFEPIVSLAGQHRIIHPDGATDEILATTAETGGKLGIVTLGSKAGEGPGPAIVHAKAAEIWYVLEGQYEFHIGDKIVDGGPGSFVAVDAGQAHGYIAKTDSKLLVVYTPGGYEQFFMDWEKLGLKPGPELGKLENKYGATRP